MRLSELGKKVLAWIIGFILVFAFATFILWLSAEADDHLRFEGACNFQGGHVVDDLCVKGNTVIMREK